MDAVGASHLDGVFEFEGAAAEDIEELVGGGEEEVRGLFDLEGLGGIDDVVGGHAVVEPAGGFGDAGGGHFLGDGGGEGDDVVFDFAFDFEESFDVDGGVGAEGLGGFEGDVAEFGEGLGGG